MVSQAQTPQNPSRLRGLLNLFMAAFSVVSGMLAILVLVVGIQESVWGRWFRLLPFCLACTVGSIVLARLARLKPVHLIGSACAGGLLLWVLLALPPHGGGIASNDASAVGSLRTLNTAEITYASTYPNGFSPTLRCLGPRAVGNPTPADAGLVDSALAGTTGNSSEKSGYRFFYAPGPRDAKGRISSYSITASPIQPGVTGTNYYYTDGSGVIRQNSTAPASAADSPIAR